MLIASPKIDQIIDDQKLENLRNFVENEIVRYFDNSKEKNKTDKDRFIELWKREVFLYKQSKARGLSFFTFWFCWYFRKCREKKTMYKKVSKRLQQKRRKTFTLTLGWK